MKIKYYNVDGGLRGEQEYDIPVFEGDAGLQALKEVILAYQSNLRQGNACTKTRGDVKGSGKKPYRQKGTVWHDKVKKEVRFGEGEELFLGQSHVIFAYALIRKKRNWH